MYRLYSICYRVTWIQVQGTKYVEGSVVVLNSSEVLPTFGIINILDEPYLLLLLLATMTYNQIQLFRINYLADQSFSHVNNIWVNLKTYSYVQRSLPE